MTTKINKKTKRGLLPRTWVIAFVIFSAIFALFYLGLSDFATDYGKTEVIKQNYNESYNKFDETMGTGEDSFAQIWEDISSGSGLELAFAATIGVFKSTFKLIRVTFDSVGIMTNMGTDFMADFGIPEEVGNIIFSLLGGILVIFLIFAVISSVSRSNKL